LGYDENPEQASSLAHADTEIERKIIKHRNVRRKSIFITQKPEGQ